MEGKKTDLGWIVDRIKTNSDISDQRLKELEEAAPEIKGMVDGGYFEFRMPSKLGYDGVAYNLVEAWMKEKGIETEYQVIQHGVREMFNNAVEHGNKEDPDKYVTVACEIIDGKIKINVKDQGQGFDPAQVPDPLEDPVKVQDERLAQGKRMGGFGLYTVKNMFEDVLFNDMGNSVTLVPKSA